MTPRTASKTDVRTALLEKGIEIMFDKGYTNTGIQEILTALKVPKGSFYHYFESKEAYAVEIIRHFDKEYTEEIMRVLGNTKETPLQRLRTYCDTHLAMLKAQECRRGCLIGNLSQEMSDQSEVLRNELLGVMLRKRELFANCIEEGQKRGEITRAHSPMEIAEFFQCGWSGAVMRAKTSHSIEPIQVFIDLMFNDILKS